MRRRWLFLPWLLLVAAGLHANPFRCTTPTSWQVLGSGGPELNARAQSGHVLWIDGKARAVFDAGAGTAVNFGKSGARIEDLDLIALTHLHSDHSQDVPAYIKASFFGERDRPLPILGPAAGHGFPSIRTFLEALFAGDHAAYGYLGGFLRDGDESYRIEPIVVAPDKESIVTVFENARLKIRAITVRHGPVPALAYRIDAGNHAVVYLGDTDARAPALVELARGADLMVANMAIPEDNNDAVAAALHAPPSRIAALAQQAGVKRLLLSHWMHRSEQAMPAILRTIAAEYRGKVDVARDGECIALPRN
ncbi:MBL fold metallo-hydrolase [Dyella sp.]|uniref:MBL fold metallo-hydrolase n=1 Tax=Dyella sp. TaxID=1869338 RepID=UPI002ED28E62